MAWVNRLGAMALNTMAIGETEWLKELGRFTMLTVMFILANSIRIEQMGSEFTFIQTVKDTKDFGKMIIKMDLAKRS